MMPDVGERVIAALGEPAARELLDVLERSDADRAAVIGRLHVRDDAAIFERKVVTALNRAAARA